MAGWEKRHKMIRMTWSVYVTSSSSLCASSVSGCLYSSAFWVNFLFFFFFFFPHTYLELVLLVFGALVKRPVISEPPDVIELVEAFDVVGHSVSLQHVLTLRDGSDGIDLQVWKRRKLRKRATGEWQGKALLSKADNNSSVTWLNMGTRRYNYTDARDTHRLLTVCVSICT